MLLGDPAAIADRIQQMGLRMRPEVDIDLIAAERDDEHSSQYAARLVNEGRADGMICGLNDHLHVHLDHIIQQLGLAPGVRQAAAMNIVILKQGVYFICDTGVTAEPDSQQLADMTLLAAEVVKRFGMTPRAALLSHSNDSSAATPLVERLSRALQAIHERDPELQIDGNLRADAALNEQIRHVIRPDSPLQGEANLLIMPNIDAARIAYDLIKSLGDAVPIGPVLLGMAHPVHLLTSSATVRRIVNASALAVVDAQVLEHQASREHGTVTSEADETV